MNLLTSPWRSVDLVDDDAEEPVEQVDDLRRDRARMASVVEPTMSTNSTETTRVSPPSSTSLPSGGRGDLLADVAPEEVAQVLALTQPADHLVEPGLELAELGAVVHLHLGVEVAVLDPLHRVADGEDRRDDGAGVEPGDQQAEAEDHRAERQHRRSASLVGEMSPMVSARIAATTRPTTGAPVPRLQKISIRRRTPKTLACTWVSPTSARAAIGRRENSLSR